MIYRGCYEYGTTKNLGAFVDEDENLSTFTVFPLIPQPDVQDPPQLEKMPIVAVDFKHSLQISKSVKKKGIYVVDANAITSRVLTFYPGQGDFYAILKFIPESSRNSKAYALTQEIATKFFPINFRCQRLLYIKGASSPRWISLNQEANTDLMHEYTVFKSRVSKAIRSAIDTKQGKFQFSVMERASASLMELLISQIPSEFPFFPAVKKRKLSLMIDRVARHDECPRHTVECKVDDLLALSTIFGDNFARLPMNARVAQLSESIQEDARMVMFFSIRILIDFVNMEVQVIVV